jgi:hypothetical protein
MSPSVDTLAGLFRLDPDRLQNLLIKRELSSQSWLNGGGPQLVREVAAAMVQRLPDALDVRLDALVSKAFLNQPQLGDAMAAAASLAEDGATEIPLPPHSLQSRHRPALQLQLGERQMHEVVFDVSLEMTLEDAVLQLRDGRPRAVTLRPAHGSGILLLGGQMLARFSDQPLPLPSLILLDAPAGMPRAPADW